MTTILYITIQITLNNTIPLYWIIGAGATIILAVAQVYGLAKNMISRVDSLEKREETRDSRLEQISQDVAYIKGKIEKL